MTITIPAWLIWTLISIPILLVMFFLWLQGIGRGWWWSLSLKLRCWKFWAKGKKRVLK